MTFPEALEAMRENLAPPMEAGDMAYNTHWMLALAEQIEANRKAIEELRKIVERGWNRCSTDYLPIGTKDTTGISNQP